MLMIHRLARSRLPRSGSPRSAHADTAVESSAASHGVLCYSLYCQLCQQGLRMTKTPISLLERLRGSFDPEAWDRFVSLYSPVILMWGRHIGLQEHDAAD